jgi:membrane protease YdiL (CAAX protease family)
MKEKLIHFREGNHVMLSSLIRPEPTTFTSFVQRHTLPVFFIMVLLLTWPLQVVDALGSHGLLPFRVPILYQILFVAYMPMVAAVVVEGMTEGKAGIKALLQKVLIWRVGMGWYIFAIFGFALFCGGAVVLAKLLSTEAIPLLGQEVANSSGVKMLLMVPLLFLVVTVINGEELAWRGFALPRLQERHSALTSSLLLGLVWVLFHLPLFLTSTGFPLDVLGILSRSIQLVGASVIFTWLYNHTRGSVLLAYLLHGSANTWTRVFPISESSAMVGWLLTALICLFAFFLLVVFGPTHLRRT